MKILAVSSAGGHFAELRMITDNLSDEFEVVIITEDKVDDECVSYYMPYSNRSNKVKYMFDFCNNFILAFKYLRKERPQKLISTGAHTAFFYFVVGKLFFKTTNIYVESFAKVTEKSLTYKLSHKFIDINVVQHEEMQSVEPNSQFFGGIY